MLAKTSRGNIRRLLARLTRSIDKGSTVAESFAAERPAIGEMETSIVAAVERAGRLDRGLTQLAAYFGALETARATVVKRAAYPVFLLHFGILSLGVSQLVTDGVPAYLRSVGFLFLLVYSTALFFTLLTLLLKDLGATSPLIDALLRWVPLVGKIRENFAVSRFCATYEMQLGAGVNVMESLTTAGRASRSALIASVAKRAVPAVLKGEQVGPLLAKSHAFPETMLRDFAVGEQTGRLDEELDRLANEHRAAALSRLDTLAEWLPRMLYLAVAGYIAYRIVSWYSGYLQQIKDITDQIK